MKKPDFTVGDYIKEIDRENGGVFKVKEIKFNHDFKEYRVYVHNYPNRYFKIENVTKFKFNHKTDFSNNWISFFERQGWKYRVLDDGRTMTIVSLLNKKVIFFIEDNKLNLKFWKRSVNKGTPSPIDSFTIFISKNNKIYVNHGQAKGYVDKTLFNLPKFLQRMELLFTAKQKGKGPAWIKDPDPTWQGFQRKNIIQINSTKNRRKIDLIFNMFFGLNKIPYDYRFIKHSALFVEFLWRNKYPALNNLSNNPSIYVCNPLLKKQLRRKNINDNKVVKYFFKNKGRKTKKLFFQIEHHNFPFYIFKYLRTRLNAGQLQNLLEIYVQNDVRTNHLDDTRFNLVKYLDNYSDIRIYNLFKTFSGNGDYQHLIDALRQLDSKKNQIILPENPKNFKEFHDDISLQYRKLQHANYKFDNIKEELLEIDGKELEVNNKKYKVIVPKDRHQLVDWGTRMNNCIASYHDRFHARICDILALESEDGLEANIEIRNGQIMQFYGNRNSRLDEEFKAPFLRLFEESKLLKYQGDIGTTEPQLFD